MESSRTLADLLGEAVQRVGRSNMLGRPGLCRNVLGDLFPDKPLVVSLLSVAVEQGAVVRLADQAPSIGVEVVGPRLAEDIAGSRGIGTEQARWALATWAVALGLSDEPVPSDPPPVAGAGNASSVGAVPSAADAQRPGGVVSVPADVAGPPPAPSVGTGDTSQPSPARDSSTPVSAGSAASASWPGATGTGSIGTGSSAAPSTEPAPGTGGSAPTGPVGPMAEGRTAEGAPGRSRPSPLVLWIAAAAALVVVVAVVVGALILTRPRPAAAAAPVVGAQVVPLPHGITTVLHAGRASRLGADPVPLGQGDGITAEDGTTQISVGHAVVRLGAGASLIYVPSGSHPAFRMVDPGQVWVQAPRGETVELQTPPDRADVTAGRIAVSCTSAACTYQALDEGEVLMRGDGTTDRLAPRQVLQTTGATDTGASMGGPSPAPTSSGMGGTMTPTPSPSASTPTMPGMPGMSSPAPSTAASADVVYMPPDILRRTPWVKTNVDLDAAQHRPYRSLGGRALVGTWTLMLSNPEVPWTYHRPLSFSVSSCPGCVMTVRSQYLASPGRLGELVGHLAAVQDPNGDSLTVTYRSVPVSCGPGMGGQETVTDTLRFTGSGKSLVVTGSRTTAFAAMDGSACRPPTSTTTTATVRMGVPGGLDRAQDVTYPGPEEWLMDQHILVPTDGATVSSCARVAKDRAATADLLCSYDPRTSPDHPRTIEYRLYDSFDALKHAYDAEVLQSGQSPGSGVCSHGKCEQPVDAGKGRMLIAGGTATAEMAAFDTRGPLMLVLATAGTNTPSIGRWQQHQSDFSFTPVNHPGL